jgi:glutaredoxin
MTTITLYTRRGCHLCDQARAILDRVARATGAPLATVDIDADPATRARYDIRVPVAVINGEEIDWPFTESRLRRAVSGSVTGP